MSRSHANALLQTKFHRPPLVAGLMQRPRLLARLDQGETCTLTLVAAPPGYGKTSLVCQWLGQRSLPAAWLQLDANDGDPAVLFTYIVYAMRTIAPGFGGETLILLQSARMPPLAVVVNTLSNELNQLSLDIPYRLVLDDYHLVQNPEIDQALATLVLRPPRGFQLLVMSRHAPSWPLGKLRIENRLLEVGAADLRFSPDETTAYLHLNAITALNDGVAVRLQKQTEGWVTGLQLAVLALRQNSDVQTVLGHYSAFVGSDNRYLLEYMVDEVLTHLPEAILKFMYKTSICTRFNVALCQALTGDDRTSVTGALRFLEQANLFLIPLDDDRKHAPGENSVWYRYHHLMEQILVSRLQEAAAPEAITDLHRRAAAWLGEQGYVEEALDHLVTIQDWAAAERLLLSELRQLLEREERGTIDRWLSVFPKTEIMGRPGLLLMQAWNCFFNQDMAGLAQILDRIQAFAAGAQPAGDATLTPGFTVNEQQEFAGQVALLRGSVAFFSGRIEATIAAAQQALLLLPRSGAFSYYNAYLFLTNAMQIAGSGDEAEAMLLQAYRSEQPKATQASARLLFALASVRFYSGNLLAAYETAELLLREARAARLVLLEGWAHDMLARIDYERNQLAAATSHFTALIERCYAIHRSCACDGFAGLMLVAAVQGRTGAVAQISDEWHSFEASLWGMPSPFFYSAQARAALLTGELDAARRWVDTFTAPLTAVPMSWFEVSHVTKIRCLLASGSPQDLAEAAKLADDCLAHAARTHNAPVQVVLNGLRALLQEQAGERQAAIELLTGGLRVTARAGFVRTYVDLGPRLADLLRAIDEPELDDHVASILAAFPNNVPAPRTLPQLLDSPAATLTQRELAVLALLASSMTLEEIAGDLFISYSTVRQHTAHIYEKLGVNKRRHAVLAATALGLLK